MKLIEEYKRSLKLLEVEEVTDLILYRPLATLLVKIVYPTNITPNQLTSIALLMGIIGTVLFFIGTSTAFLIGAICLIIYDFFDCADGQLARLKGTGTLTGRIVDGFADYIVAVLTYLGIGFGFASNSNDPLFWWVLTVLAGISNALHSVAVDYYRNQFMDYALDRESLLDEDLKKFETEYKRLVSENIRSYDRLIIWFYLNYSALQIKFSSDSDKEKMVRYDAKDYYNKNKLILHLWTYIGPSTDLTVVIVCALFNRWDLFMIWMVGVSNIYALILYFFQRKINKTIKTGGEK
jgi:hypothetical protein